MKKFISKILLFAGICVVLAIIPSIVIDPYNVFHWKNVTDNGVEPNKNYIKMKYILSNPDKFDTYLFGSSRVGAIHVEKIEGEKCYNMTYSAGMPEEHLKNIKTMFENGIYPKRIYMGIDSFAYTVDSSEHIEEPMRCPYENLDIATFIKLYITPNVAFDSLQTTYESRMERTENYSEIFYEYGWWCDYGEPGIPSDADMSPFVGGSYLMDEAIATIQEIKDVCEENGVEIIFFTNPMFYTTYATSVSKNYYEFLERVAEVTDYYNFNCYNEFNISTSNFTDTSHYNAEVGDMIINVITKGEKYDNLYDAGFGYYVTKDNVDELLAILREQLPES